MRALHFVLLALLALPAVPALADGPKISDDLEEIRGELQRTDKLLSENTRESAGRAQERLSIVREKFEKLAERLGRGDWKASEKGPGDKPAVSRVVIDDASFNALGRALTEAKTPSLKETVLRTQLATVYVTSEQTLKLLKTYRHDDERMNALKLIAPRLYDHKNTLIIGNAFDHADEKEKALKIVSQ